MVFPYRSYPIIAIIRIAASAADVDAITQAFKALAGVADSAEAADGDAPAAE